MSKVNTTPAPEAKATATAKTEAPAKKEVVKRDAVGNKVTSSAAAINKQLLANKGKWLEINKAFKAHKRSRVTAHLQYLKNKHDFEFETKRENKSTFVKLVKAPVKKAAK